MNPKNRERDKMGVNARSLKRSMSERIIQAMDEWVDDHRWSAYVLGGVAVGVVTAVAIAAPGALNGSYRVFRKRATRQQLGKARLRLLREGYIRPVSRGVGSGRYALTKKGERKLAKFLLELSQKRKQPQWDNLWRMLLYDIPEKHRAYRDRIRQIIRLFGCYQLQKNVWVYPYPDLHELLMYLHLLYGKGTADMVVFEVKRFSGDETVRKFFQL